MRLLFLYNGYLLAFVLRYDCLKLFNYCLCVILFFKIFKSDCLPQV